MTQGSDAGDVFILLMNKQRAVNLRTLELGLLVPRSFSAEFTRPAGPGASAEDILYFASNHHTVMPASYCPTEDKIKALGLLLGITLDAG